MTYAQRTHPSALLTKQLFTGNESYSTDIIQRRNTEVFKSGMAGANLFLYSVVSIKVVEKLKLSQN